jgi:calcineurin-like phosphoesterase family protein
MSIFFTSDTHFGHAQALARFHRPFASVDAMNAGMVARWNEVVGSDDDVWHLGDFAIKLAEPALSRIFNSLAGRKHLVRGNNDGEATTALRGWASVQDYAEIEVDGTRLVLCHYPFRTWNGMYKGALNLHGHSHGQLKGLTRQIDVGVDVWDFRPVTLAQLRGRRAARRAVA